MLTEPSIRDRILEAAVSAAADHGIARLSVGDVAKRAGLSRQTLYKHFPSKEVLVEEAVLEEAARILRQVAAVVDPIDDPRLALEAGIRESLRLTRRHPILERLIRTEPESLLPLLTTGDSSVLLVVRAAVRGIIERKFPALDADGSRRCADLIARVLVSYAVGPPDEPDEDQAEFMADLLFGRVLAMAGLS